MKKILKMPIEMWDAVSWKEIFVISILMIITMTLIKVYLADYTIQCEDGTMHSIEHGMNYNICDGYVYFNAITGVATYHGTQDYQWEDKKKWQQ